MLLPLAESQKSEQHNWINTDAKKFAQGDMTVLGNLIFNVRVAIESEYDLIDLCEKKYEELKTGA